MKMNKVTKRIILVCAVLAVIVLLALIPKGKGNKIALQEEETVRAVTALEISKQDITEYLTMNGNIQADNTISVFPNINGKITKVFVTLGSTVKRGEVIAEVDPSTPGSRYDASPVTTPIAGTITALPLTVGTSVNTSTAVAQLGNIKELQIKARVPERDIAVLKTGLNAEVSLVAFKGEVLKAHVIRVSPIVDEVSRSKEIYFAFDEADSKINAGMYAKIKLFTTTHKNQIVIPFDSVNSSDGKYYVFVIKDDSYVEMREVSLGVNVDGNVQILSGLSEGEKIVASGIQSLTDGSKINIVE